MDGWNSSGVLEHDSVLEWRFPGETEPAKLYAWAALRIGIGTLGTDSPGQVNES